MADIPPPPPGFQLDSQASPPPPPPGFKLYAAPHPPPPPGFNLDQPAAPKKDSGILSQSEDAYTSGVSGAWDKLKSDFVASQPDKEKFNKAGFWDRQKQQFNQILSAGKSPADAFSLAMSATGIPQAIGAVNEAAGRGVSDVLPAIKGSKTLGSKEQVAKSFSDNLGAAEMAVAPEKGEALGAAKPAPSETPAAAPKPTSAFQEGRKLDDDLNLLTQKHYRRGIEAVQALESAPKDVPQATWEKFVHHEETPDKVPLTPGERALYDKHVKPLVEKNNQLYSEAQKLGITKEDLANSDIKPGKIGDLGYTPRFAKGKPNFIQRMVTPDKGIPGGKTLGTQAGQLKGRTTGGQSIAEIEEQAGQDKYYKHVLVNRAAANVELERAVENAKFLKSRIPDLEEKGLIAPKDAEVPAGFIKTKIPGLNNRYMAPEVAHSLDDYWGAFKDNKTPIGAALSKVNQTIGRVMFMLPVRHVLNIADTWAQAKGVSSLVNPKAYMRFPSTFAKAVDDVRTQGPLFKQVLDNGGALQTAREGQMNLHRVMLKKMGAEVAANPGMFSGIAKAMGHANPMTLARRLIAGSEDRHVLWASGDMLYMQHIRSLMSQGMKLKDAIAETEKTIPNYRVPSQIYNGPGGRAAAQLYKDRNLTFFGRYRYGLLRSYADTLKNIVKPVAAGDRAKALDRLGMMGFMGLVGYPFLDSAVQKATGNKNASFMRGGLSTLPYDVSLASKGEKDASQILESLITPAPGTTEPFELLYNHDLFSGQQIYDPTNPAAAAGQIGARELGQSGLVGAGQRIFSGKTDARRLVEQQFGISDPTDQQVAGAKKFRARDKKAWTKKENQTSSKIKQDLGIGDQP